LFFKIIIKLYYWLFKIRKYEFKGKSLAFVFNQKAMHILAIILVITVSVFSLSARTQASFDPKRMKESIMAQAVISDLDILGQDELIIETAEEFNFDQTKQVIRYLSDSQIKRPMNYLGWEDKTQETINDFNKNGEALTSIKPLGINLTSEETPISQETVSTRTEIIEYEIQSGDTVSSIAYKFSLKTNTVLWANNLSSFSLIRPGNTLIILPTDGVLHTVKSGENLSYLAQRYNVSSQEISDYNNIRANTIAINQKLIIPGATRLRAPVQTIAVSPTPTPRPSSPAPTPSIDGKMAWPTEGHRITQYFSWRHNGLDVANKTGTAIYAAEAGVIEFSGWSTGYGNNIIIDHGGGKKTRYAHMSRMFVVVGQRVARGEHIAAMGSTGWSTGPHLHFEVIINGVRQNPLNYLR
jgi:murein DD-endopeptidase MepM/ murein hydrolase activator NlpD